METKPAQNIQDSFLNTARKDKSVITIYLLSGVKLTGRIRSFDKYSVVLETNNQEQLIFKHAISTVVMARVVHAERHLDSRPMVETACSDAGHNRGVRVRGIAYFARAGNQLRSESPLPANRPGPSGTGFSGGSGVLLARRAQASAQRSARGRRCRPSECRVASSTSGSVPPSARVARDAASAFLHVDDHRGSRLLHRRVDGRAARTRYQRRRQHRRRDAATPSQARSRQHLSAAASWKN